MKTDNGPPCRKCGHRGWSYRVFFANQVEATCGWCFKPEHFNMADTRDLNIDKIVRSHNNFRGML